MTSHATPRDRTKIWPKAIGPARPQVAAPQPGIRGQEVVERLRAAARRAAELASLEPTVMVVDDATHAGCLVRLTGPALRNEPLRRMLKTAAPWDPA